MDSATGWVLGILGALVGGVILLYIEYGYFQKRSQVAELQRPGNDVGSLWKDAINRAVKDFSTNHPDSTVKISSWTVTDDKARVHLFIKKKPLAPRLAGRFPRRSIPYTLVVDRAGDILEIKHS